MYSAAAAIAARKAREEQPREERRRNVDKDLHEHPRLRSYEAGAARQPSLPRSPAYGSSTPDGRPPTRPTTADFARSDSRKALLGHAGERGTDGVEDSRPSVVHDHGLPEAVPADALGISLPPAEGDKEEAGLAKKEPPGPVRRFFQKLNANEDVFFLVPPTNFARKHVIRLTQWKWFVRLTLLVIFANCLFLGIEDPNKGANPNLEHVLAKAEIVFTALFTVECVLQVTTKCFLFGPSAYLQSPWHWLDFICVVTGYSFLLPEGSGNLTGLRAFRALRPLRTVASIPGMRNLVLTLLESIPLLINVMYLLLWLFFVFGIVGMHMFMGRLHGRCGTVMPDGTLGMIVDEERPCTLGKRGHRCDEGLKCFNVGRNPRDGFVSYDNFLWAFFNIFTVFITQGWTTDQMYLFEDGVGSQALVFFILLVLLGAFFALNLLTAIISTKFAQVSVKSKSKGPSVRLNKLRHSFSSVKQRTTGWLDKIDVFHCIRGRPPWRRFFSRIIGARWFQNAITALILINTLIMAMDHFGMPTKMRDALEIINLVLTAGFTLEMLLKHLGMGFYQYWKNGWNVLDGFIVIISLLELLASAASGDSGLSSLRTFRLLRVLRSLKLLRSFAGLRKLMVMVLKGFVALKDFFALLLLFIFIFSILGMQLFGGKDRFQDTRENFNSLWQAALTVFEILTGCNWYLICWNAMLSQGYQAALYFIGWIVIGRFVLLTLFLAILITNFQSDEEPGDLSSRAGSVYDGDSTCGDVQPVEKDGPGASVNNGTMPRGNDHSCSTSGRVSMESRPSWEGELAHDEAKGRRASVGSKGGEVQLSLGAPKENGKVYADEDTPTAVFWEDKAGKAGVSVNGHVLTLEDATMTTTAGRKRESEESPRGTRYKHADDTPAPYSEDDLPLGRYSDHGGGNKVHPEGGADLGAMADRSLCLSFSRNFRSSFSGGVGSSGTRQAFNTSVRPGGTHPRGNMLAARMEALSGGNMVEEVGGMNAFLLSIGETHGIKDTCDEWVAEHAARTALGVDESVLDTARERKEAEYLDYWHTQWAALREDWVAALQAVYGTTPGGAKVTVTGGKRWRAKSLGMLGGGAPKHGGGGHSPFFPLHGPAVSDRGSVPAAPSNIQPLDERNGGVATFTNFLNGHDPAAAGGVLPGPASPRAELNTADGPSQGANGGPSGSDAAAKLLAFQTPDGKVSRSLRKGVPVFSGLEEVDDDSPPLMGDTPEELQLHRNSSLDEGQVGATTGGDGSGHGGAGGQNPGAGGALANSGAQQDAGAEVGAVTADGRVSLATISPAITDQSSSPGGGDMMAVVPAGAHDVAPRKISDAEYGAGPGKAFHGPLIVTQMQAANGMHPFSPLARFQAEAALSGGTTPTYSPSHALLSEAQSPMPPRVGGHAAWGQIVAVEGEPGSSFKKRGTKGSAAEPPLDVYMMHRSLFVLLPSNPVRQRAQRIIKARWFEWVILFCITFSSVLLTLESPKLEEDAAILDMIIICDIIFAIIFAIECLLKVVAMGFVLHKGAYLRVAWNVLDFIIVVTSLLSLAVTSGGLSILRSMRLMRALRPLRMVSRFRGMQLVLLTLVRSFPAVVNVVSFGTFQFMVFGILGIQLFAGKMHACNDGAVSHRAQCADYFCPFDLVPLANASANVSTSLGAASNGTWSSPESTTLPVSTVVRSLIVGNLTGNGTSAATPLPAFGCSNGFTGGTGIGGMILREARNDTLPGTFYCPLGDDVGGVSPCDTGLLAPREWAAAPLNFDNIYEGVITLFIVATLDDWMTVTWQCMDAVAVDRQPVANHAPWMSLYVLAFVFLGAFFWVNLLIGVIVDHYSRLVAEEGNNLLMTESQRKWMEVLKLKGSSRTVDKKTLHTKGWGPRAVAARMILHPAFDKAIIGCICLNILIMAMRYDGQGEAYTRALAILNQIFSSVFIFEAAVKITALGPRGYISDNWNKFDMFIVLTSIPDMIGNLGVETTVFRIFRIARMFKLIKSAKGLRTLFNTLITSLPAIANVGSLLFLLMFVYGVVGMSLFGDKAFVGSIGDQANFRDFPSALSTLFRVFSGDAWSALLRDTGHCNNLGECRGSVVSKLYFISFVVLASFVMLNLIVAVILDKFIESASDEGLLRSSAFFDILIKKLTLDHFICRLRTKIQRYHVALKLRDDLVFYKKLHAKRAAAAASERAGGASRLVFATGLQLKKVALRKDKEGGGAPGSPSYHGSAAGSEPGTPAAMVSPDVANVIHDEAGKSHLVVHGRVLRLDFKSMPLNDLAQFKLHLGDELPRPAGGTGMATVALAMSAATAAAPTMAAATAPAAVAGWGKQRAPATLPSGD